MTGEELYKELKAVTVDKAGAGEVTMLQVFVASIMLLCDVLYSSPVQLRPVARVITVRAVRSGEVNEAAVLSEIESEIER